MSFPRYPKYEASDVEWLGDVPAHWEVKRLRQIGRLLKGGGGTKEDVVDAGLPCVRYGDLYTTFSFHITKPRGFIAPERATDYTPISFGDVLFAASGEKLAEIGKSAVNLLEVPAVCGGDVVILRPEIDVESRFLGYACDSPTAAMQKASMGRGTTVKHIYPDELRLILLALPPLPEQRAIAAFLDRETAKIDGLVAEQQRLIELLKEKRQAVISHAVTKGLDPKAPMKPSGVEWLGDVPAHWELKPLRHLRCALQTGPFGSQLHADEYIEGGIPVVNPINLVEGGILPTDSVTVSEQTARRLSHQRLQAGDIVFARRGELGRCAQVTNQEVGWLCGTGSMVLRLEDVGVETSYFARYLAIPATRHYFTLHCIGSVMPSLNTSTLLGLVILLPPVEEQRRIDAACTELLGRLDRLVAEAESAITLLQERRSALISAAVTGQIDVRNAVATEAA